MQKTTHSVMSGFFYVFFLKRRSFADALRSNGYARTSLTSSARAAQDARLCEVAHIAQSKSVEKAVFAKPKKVAAFTLSEVLITLGVIGIVAAMTLPNLIANYKNLVLSTQLKKFVTTMDNGARMLLANEEVDYLSDTSLFYSPVFNKTRGSACLYLNYNLLEKHFKLTPLPESSKFVESLTYYEIDKSYSTREGACLAFGYKGNYLVFDVNCDKSPNKWGYDRYLVADGFSCLVSDNPKATTFFNDAAKLSVENMESLYGMSIVTAKDSVFKERWDEESLLGFLELFGFALRYYDGWNIKW